MWVIQYATIYSHVGNMWSTCRQGIMCGPYVAKKFGVNSLKILPHIGHMWQSKSKVPNGFCHIWVIYVRRCLAYMWLKILPLICHMWPKCRILNGPHMANMWNFFAGTNIIGAKRSWITSIFFIERVNIEGKRGTSKTQYFWPSLE